MTGAEFDLAPSSTEKYNKVEEEKVWQESVQGSIPPITLTKQEVVGDINYGSFVKYLNSNKEVIRGVVRWLGHTGDPQKIVAGIEMVGNAEVINSQIAKLNVKSFLSQIQLK